MDNKKYLNGIPLGEVHVIAGEPKLPIEEWMKQFNVNSLLTNISVSFAELFPELDKDLHLKYLSDDRHAENANLFKRHIGIFLRQWYEENTD
jgi:hypothetical protein